MKNDLNLSPVETEILILKSVLDSINSMVNHEVMKLSHKDPNSEIRFPTHTHRQFFNIILLDFLQSKLFQTDKHCLESLQDVIANPLLTQNIAPLKIAVVGFQEWLEKDVELSDDGEVHKFWFPSIDSPTLDGNIALQITRSEFIKICGNISKHNALGLDRQAETIQKIFKRNNVAIDLTQALLLMEEFYAHFHEDIFAYHCSTIAEFLNNIGLGIHEYLKPEFEKSITYHWNPHHKMDDYKFTYPANVNNAFARNLYWELMNLVRGKPYMPHFSINNIFKMRY
jgi:hypothetical protein